MAIKASQITELRDRTGSGIKDCKAALTECDGNVEEAVEFLRKKGLAAADKKSGRSTNAGRVFSYIHTNGTVGVMLEMNCETDFVANTDKFKDLGKDLAMQVCAMLPAAVDRESLPKDIVEKEKDVYREQMKDTLKKKPKKAREKILEGKLNKFFKESCLMEQQFIKDEKRTVEDIIKESIATLKENITIKRFARFQIGD